MNWVSEVKAFLLGHASSESHQTSFHSLDHHSTHTSIHLAALVFSMLGGAITLSSSCRSASLVTVHRSFTAFVFRQKCCVNFIYLNELLSNMLFAWSANNIVIDEETKYEMMHLLSVSAVVASPLSISREQRALTFQRDFLKMIMYFFY